jgi:hypothetical protein
MYPRCRWEKIGQVDPNLLREMLGVDDGIDRAVTVSRVAAGSCRGVPMACIGEDRGESPSSPVQRPLSLGGASQHHCIREYCLLPRNFRSSLEQDPSGAEGVALLNTVIDTRESVYTFLDVLEDYASVGKTEGVDAFIQLCQLNQVVSTVDSQPGEWEELSGPEALPTTMVDHIPARATDLKHAQVPYVILSGCPRQLQKVLGRYANELQTVLGPYGYTVWTANGKSCRKWSKDKGSEDKRSEDARTISYVEYTTEDGQHGKYAYSVLHRLQGGLVAVHGKGPGHDSDFLVRVRDEMQKLTARRATSHRPLPRRLLSRAHHTQTVFDALQRSDGV